MAIQEFVVPAGIKGRGEEGQCIVEVVVGEDGQPGDPRVKKSSGHAMLDMETLRVVRAMPAWTPGAQGGKKGAIVVELPVFLNLQDGGC